MPTASCIYLGRADDQVKIRGFRVELGEIEGAIAAEPGVAAVAVTVRPLAGIEQLVAFVAAVNGSTPTSSRLRQALDQRLPRYMVPAHFEFVVELPRLTSGKVDRKALSGFPLDIAVDEEAEDAKPRLGGERKPCTRRCGRSFPASRCVGNSISLTTWAAIRCWWPGWYRRCGPIAATPR